MTSAAVSKVDAAGGVWRLGTSHGGQAAGYTLQVRFVKNSEVNYTNMHGDVICVSGGTIVSASRITEISATGWNLTAQPEGDRVVSLSIGSTGDRSTASTVYTSEGDKLLAGSTVSVLRAQ